MNAPDCSARPLKALLVYRYNPNGTLDSAFNSNQFPFCFQFTNCVNGLQYERVTPTKVIVQTDDKILVGGTSVATGLLSSTVKLVLLRLNPDGTLDNSFGISGKLVLDAGNDNDRILALSIQADGKILAVGVRQIAFAALRFNSNGSLNATFGTGGIVRLTSISNGVAEAVQVQADGKIIIGGHSGANLVVVRLNANGTLDSGFGANGTVTIQFNTLLGLPLDAELSTVIALPDGRLLITGAINLAGVNIGAAIAVLDTNGLLDLNFDGDGKLTLELNLGIGSAADLQIDGRIVIGGDNLIRIDLFGDVNVTPTPTPTPTPNPTPTPSETVPTSPGDNVPAVSNNFSVRYARIVTGGETTFQPLSPDSFNDLPAGYVIAPESLAVNITTTATYTGGVEVGVKLDNPPSNPADFARCRILQRFGSGYVDVTWRYDVANGQIFARTKYIGQFVVVNLQPNVMDCAANVSFVQLGATQYTVNENARFVTATMQRFCRLDEAVSVTFNTSNTSAEQRNDYTIGTTRVNFAASETSRTVTVIITGDVRVEDTNELVFLALTNPVNTRLGANVAGMLNAVNDDTTAPTANPVDDSRFFVNQQYADFLNRVPDQGGEDYWTGQITQCDADQNCINRQRIGVSAEFFIALEFQETGFVVYQLYRAAFGSMAAPFGTRANVLYAEFARDRSQLVGDSGLQQSTQDFVARFVNRADFLDVYPASLTNEQYVNRLFDNASLTPYTAERQAEINAMNTQGRTRAQVLSNVTNIQAFKDREKNPAFVLMQYFGYLRRDPDQGGYDFWLGVLNSQNSPRMMVCNFLTSREYQERFSAVSLRDNSLCGGNP